jgi:MoaA/NifB/PqqE/SkfB family radical SAM enzyme
MVTNQCPLRCAHCGPRSGPGEKGALDLATVVAALDEARRHSCRIVNFSGGEPFILGRLLVDFVRATSERGIWPRITTGAYWSNNAEAARKRIEPLAQAGLRQLFISCSDAHRVYVPFSNVLEATRAARAHNIDVCIVVGTSKTSNTTPSAVREGFEAEGINPPWLLESPLIPLGRAEENISFDELLLQPLEDFKGPCPSLTEHPTIQPDGQVTGCASVFARDCSPLVFGDIRENTLGEVIERMDNNTLAAWIHKVGVVELKQLIEANSTIVFPDRYVNICHLCADILNNAEARVVLDELGLGPAPEEVQAVEQAL